MCFNFNADLILKEEKPWFWLFFRSKIIGCTDIFVALK
jgi:hypothetical protein